MKLERAILEISGSLYLPIPQDLAKYMSLAKGNLVIIEDSPSHTAKFWKKKQDKEEQNPGELP